MKLIIRDLLIAIVFILVVFTVGCKPADISSEKPEDNRFTTEVLASNLDEPMQFELMEDGRVLFAERKGKLKVYDPRTKAVTVVAEIPVRHTFAGYTSSGTHESEDGIHGVLLDPSFNTNHWIYLYYAPEVGGPKNILSRFEWKNERVNVLSEKVLLEVSLDTSVCCHLGGGLVFDNDHNLLIATGENGQAEDGFSTLDERPGHETSDAQRTSANSNSLNGKILRIHPENNGTYTIPAGNLFPPGTPKTRPEIYTMGNRNPWRITIDFKTGWLYWGEVGPNGDQDSEDRGPRAYDEFNQARRAGNFGYPHFIADNKPYRRFDFETGKPGAKFDPLNPLNLSRNNTGITELPPAQPAFIWYPYRASDSFPQLGTGAMSAVGGPIYRKEKLRAAANPFPAYYEGKWFITDWVRGWIMAVSMDEQGNYKSMEPFLPDQKHYGIIDIDFGPDGSLYLLEYGTGVFRASPEARLVKISYSAGNRAPIAKAVVAKSAGIAPLQTTLDGSNSTDPDGDRLTYKWTFHGPGNELVIVDKVAAQLVLSKMGHYRGQLTVTDSRGLSATTEFNMTVGNEQPNIKIDLNGANQSFYRRDQKIDYAVDVTDAEDGSTSMGTIPTEKVRVEIDRMEILNSAALESLPWKQEETTTNMLANLLINNSDCRSCHGLKDPSIGPSFLQVADKYKNDQKAVTKLAAKIINGGNGSWGERMMPAHPGLTENEARTLATYVLSTNSGTKPLSKPLKGAYKLISPKDAGKQEFLVLRASYKDRGGNGVSALDATRRIVLRNSFLPVSRVDGYQGVDFNRQVDLDNSEISSLLPGGWLLLRAVDLNKISEVKFNAFSTIDSALKSPWYIEVRIDSINGPIIGKSLAIPSEKDPFVQQGGRISATLAKTVGKHDVYFRLRCAASKPVDRIRIRDIQFVLD